MDEQAFYLDIAHALSGCQQVERRLKLYIREALELAKKCIGDQMTFNMTGDDFEAAPLGRLIQTFGNFSNNRDLITELRQFKKNRDILAHSGIADCLDPDGELSYLEVDEFRKTLLAIRNDAPRLQTAIHEEALKYLGNLLFDALPDEKD
jgi:hypothetical protein